MLQRKKTKALEIIYDGLFKFLTQLIKSNYLVAVLLLLDDGDYITDLTINSVSNVEDLCFLFGK